MNTDLLAQGAVDIDLFQLVAQQRGAQGVLPLSALLRFMQDAPVQAEGAMLHWRLTPLAKKPHEPALLQVHIQASPTLQCERCLQPFVYPIDVQTVVQLSATEEEFLADVDPVSGEIDYYAYEKWLVKTPCEPTALIGWLEEELLLALPYVPKHEDCEPPVSTGYVDEAIEPVGVDSPFAILRKLKS